MLIWHTDFRYVWDFKMFSNKVLYADKCDIYTLFTRLDYFFEIITDTPIGDPGYPPGYLGYCAVLITTLLP